MKKVYVRDGKIYCKDYRRIMIKEGKIFAIDTKENWITTETGSHIKLDENGTAIGGAGGALNGKQYTPAQKNGKISPKGGGTMKAPNGENSNLNKKQYESTRSESFKKWFGDFEKDPKNASKAVDENGDPKVMYHGTPSGGFSVFDPESSYSEGKKIANFFSDNPSVVKETYAVKNQYLGGKPQVYKCYINLKNPLVIEGNGQKWNELDMPKEMPSLRFRNYATGGYSESRKTDTDGITKWAKSKGYDGVIFKNIIDGNAAKGRKSTVMAVFESNQIKDATGKNKNFDINKDDIYE